MQALALSFIIAASAVPNSGVNVSETRTFAGKLGYRVVRTVSIEQNGKTVQIKLPAFHDRFKPLPKLPR